MSVKKEYWVTFAPVEKGMGKGLTFGAEPSFVKVTSRMENKTEYKIADVKELSRLIRGLYVMGEHVFGVENMERGMKDAVN